MLAVHIMSGGAMAVFFLVAVILFVLGALAAVPARSPVSAGRARFMALSMVFIALGLAVATWVSFWNAWALA